MNKRNTKSIRTTGVYKSERLNLVDKYKSYKTIYMVKCKEIHYKPESKNMTNNTYELLTFEKLDKAKGYMNIVYNAIVTPCVTSGEFKILIDNTTNEIQSNPNGNEIIYARTTKLIGNINTNISQTILFTFTVKAIKFIPY